MPQRMCATSSARPQCTTTFPSTGTVSSSGCTLGTTARRTSATSSSPSSCRYVGYIQTPTDQCQVFHFAFEATIFTLGILVSSVFFSFFLGAAAGACTPGIRPKGQRQEWRHLLHGLQWHYGHHQTPHAHTVCGGEPCLSECVCVRGALTDRIICHHREYSDDGPKIIFIAGSSVVSVRTRLWHLPLFGVANC